MAEFWETAFSKMKLAWGEAPTASASLAADYLARSAAKDVLIPGIGYGRNAKPFLERGMSVSGIEISETAIELARSRLGLEIPIIHGSVTDMPFDHRRYDGIFCHGLIYLLDARGRAKLIRDCYRQLAPGGHMIFTVISKKAPMYGQGPRLGDDWYERLPGLPMYFYDAASLKRQLDPYGLVELAEVDEPAGDGVSLPFIYAACRRDADATVGADEAVERLRAGQREITIDGPPGQARAEAIAHALPTSKTTILRMGACQLTDLAALALARAFGKSALLELWLFNNQIGDIGARAIADALGGNASLATLCLNENRIGALGAAAIGQALRSSASLVELGLGRNEIGDTGAAAIGAALASNGSLTALSLNDNQIGDIGAASIADGLRSNTSLETLRLSNNAIGDTGAAALLAAVASNSTSRTITFEGNPASPAMCAALQAAANARRP